jgi:hypothetical protein
MDLLPELLKVGDQVMFRDSPITAVGVIVSKMMLDYVAVRWSDVHLITSHRRGNLQHLLCDR